MCGFGGSWRWRAWQCFRNFPKKLRENAYYCATALALFSMSIRTLVLVACSSTININNDATATCIKYKIYDTIL